MVYLGVFRRSKGICFYIVIYGFYRIYYMFFDNIRLYLLSSFETRVLVRDELENYKSVSSK